MVQLDWAERIRRYLEPVAANTTPELEIRALFDVQTKAIRAGDVDAILDLYAPGTVSFDVIPPLRNRGIDSVRRRIETWLGSYEGPVGSEIRSLDIAASGDVAFCHFLQRFTGVMKSGAAVDMWVRVTVGLRRQSGAWQIVHQHMSEPFDPDSGRARLDLQP
jgi:ketosteroid isomerase-like protein